MLKKIIRLFSKNPFEKILQKAKKNKAKTFLFCWNRGLGDIALGLYALVYRTKQVIPEAKISFLVRENLQEGFALLEGIEKVLIAKHWQRAKPYNVEETLQELQIDSKNYDVIIPWPDPTYWAKWQRGKVVPKLKWQKTWQNFHQRFSLSEDFLYIGAQVSAETSYGLWRNWPLENWQKLFSYMEKYSQVKFILFGFEKKPNFLSKNIVDLRGKTSLFEMLSIIKNSCSFMILGDSGVLSMSYYLDDNFPLHILSLWADPCHGILKQNVPSPNPSLQHTPFLAKKKNLQNLCYEEIAMFLEEKLEKRILEK